MAQEFARAQDIAHEDHHAHVLRGWILSGAALAEVQRRIESGELEAETPGAPAAVQTSAGGTA